MLIESLSRTRAQRARLAGRGVRLHIRRALCRTADVYAGTVYQPVELQPAAGSDTHHRPSPFNVRLKTAAMAILGRS